MTARKRRSTAPRERAAESPETDTSTAPAAPKFLPADLVRAAAHFGASRDMMAGALASVTRPLTMAEAQARLDAFKNKPTR